MCSLSVIPGRRGSWGGRCPSHAAGNGVEAIISDGPDQLVPDFIEDQTQGPDLIGQRGYGLGQSINLLGALCRRLGGCGSFGHGRRIVPANHCTSNAASLS